MTLFDQRGQKVGNQYNQLSEEILTDIAYHLKKAKLNINKNPEEALKNIEKVAALLQIDVSK